MSTTSPDSPLPSEAPLTDQSTPDVARTPAASAPIRGDRALVFAGGGSTGNAWVIGVVAGLLEAGLDVTEPDLAVGTSAGATAAVQLLGADPVVLLQAILDAVPPQATGRPRNDAKPTPPHRPTVNHLERTSAIIASAKDADDMRRKMGAGARELDAASDGSWTSSWRATVAARLPDPQWPERAVAITVLDAFTGKPVVFDKFSGVEIVDAVAASCSSGLPYRIGNGLYIDGGYRRNENADLAAGFRRVLVLSPFGGRSRHPHAWGMDLATQVEELRAAGSLVETIMPDEDATHLFGANAMSPALRAPAAHAGYRQGLSLAPALRRFWS